MKFNKKEVDAISRRRRAQQSLVDSTFEELETFLQESDDEKGLPNVDDQEEYRKFLASVLLEDRDAKSQDEVNETLDDDEDNDADFQFEIEEALMDSDTDENLECNKERDARCETIDDDTRNSNDKDRNTLLGQTVVPLRPILPYTYIPQASHIQLPHPQLYQYPRQPIYGFTPKQIGQLHCLIHEHVQLLIQIFSVCVLDITEKDIASEYRKMILEIMSTREESLVVQKVAYPEYIFKHPNVYPSSQDSNTLNWAPQINNPVLSILDVAPLRLAKEFMNDVNNCVLHQRQNCLDAYKTDSRTPLFSLPRNDASLIESDDSSGPAESKKSLASVLIDRTKKLSVALAPIIIVRLAQVFYPLFNAALFPFKPPPQAVVNRVLFTESEDGLLAMGYMQYNHDWKAIRQRFLPCKTENQIFVRYKNRVSSNAPDNPIKICSVLCTSQEDLNNHYQGKNHKRELKLVKLEGGQKEMTKDENSNQMKRKGVEESWTNKKRKVFDERHPVAMRCDICNVVVNSQIVYESHIAGSKHAAMVKKLQGHPVAMRCDICNVVVNSQIVYESHIAGSKHAAMVKKLQLQQQEVTAVADEENTQYRIFQ